MLEDLKISIIIPCYNVSKYLRKCLESVADQTYSNLEIICINDGSTDNTLEILLNFESKDSRFKIYDQKNQGLSKTRSLGITYATGDYTLFVDGDDWLETNCIEFLLTKKADFDIVCFSYFREFKNLTIAKKFDLEGNFSAEKIQRIIVGPLAEDSYHIDGIDSLVTVWGKLYKSEKLKNIDFVDVNEIGTWEDGLFNFDVLEKCKKVLIINQPFYHYRKDNEQSFTSVAKKDLYKKWLTKFQIISGKIKTKDISFQNALQNRIAISVLGLTLTEMNSPGSLFRKNKVIRTILLQPAYNSALQQLNIKQLPLHWKLFFGSAKRKFSWGVVFLTKMIQVIQKVKNL